MPEPHHLLRNALREKMLRGEVATSLTVRLVPTIEIVGLAQSAGFDSIYVDLEHSAFSVATCSQICIAALYAGLPCFVRVPGVNGEAISRALDGGALGVIVPDVRTAGDAQIAVRAAKYTPLGARGMSGALPQIGFRPAGSAPAEINAATMVIVQFESMEAAENCEAIIGVDGVEMVLVGANDLLADMGATGNFDDPRLMVTYRRILDACLKAGKFLGVGGLQSRPDLAELLLREGAHFVSAGADVGILSAALGSKVTSLTKLFLDSRKPW